MYNLWKETPLRAFLTRSKKMVELRGDVTYKQITVRLHHKGVILREEKEGIRIGSTKQFKVKSGQLILSRIDARNGAIGIVPDELNGAIVTNDFWVFTIDRNQIDGKFLDYYVGTSLFTEKCRRASEGTTNRIRLQPERFLNITILLPPLPEQQRIVTRIEKLTARIEEAKRLRRESVEETEKIVFCTVKHLLRPKDDWQAKRISDCSVMKTGTTPASYRKNYYGGTLQWYTPGDLGFHKRLGRSYRTVSDVAVAERKVRIFEPGTVLLVAIGASLGKVGLTHEHCSSNQQITGIKFSTNILPEYGFWWMRSLYDELRAVAPQATLPIINQQRIGEFEIAAPPLSDQRRIVDYLDKLQSRVDELRKYQAETQKQIDALSQSILARAFRGEL